MNKDNLGQCRTCGELISKNLGTRESSYGSSSQGPIRFSTSSPGNCPHCGEADPHLTDEEVERREQIITERIKEGAEKARKEDRGCMIQLYLFIATWVFFLFIFPFMLDGGCSGCN